MTIFEQHAVCPGGWPTEWCGERFLIDGVGSLDRPVLAGCTGISCPQPSVAVTLATNHLIGPPYAYDANGNMTNDGLNTQIVYDAENHATSASGSLGSGNMGTDGTFPHAFSKGITIRQTRALTSRDQFSKASPACALGAAPFLGRPPFLGVS